MIKKFQTYIRESKDHYEFINDIEKRLTRSQTMPANLTVVPSMQNYFSNPLLQGNDFNKFMNDTKFYYNNFIKKNIFFCRIMYQQPSTGLIKDVRQDRRPLDTDKEIHDEINDIMKKKFNGKTRSNCLFTRRLIINSIDNFVVFPIGKFDYIVHEYAYDLFDYLDEHDDDYIDIEEIVDDYKLNPVLMVGEKHKEVLLYCKKYYAFKVSKQ